VGQERRDALGNSWRAQHAGMREPWLAPELATCSPQDSGAETCSTEVPDLGTCPYDETELDACSVELPPRRPPPTCWLDEEASGPAVLRPGVEAALIAAGLPEYRLVDLRDVELRPVDAPSNALPSAELEPGRSRARPLDADAAPADFDVTASGPGSLREILARHERTWLSHLLADVEPDDVQLAVALAEAAGEPEVAAYLRRSLFAAHQQATLDALQVESSTRYQRETGKTFCNVYAHDVARLAGLEVPRTWWDDDELGTSDRLVDADGRRPDGATPGDPLKPIAGETVHEVNTRLMVPWFVNQGSRFGWTKLSGPEEAQRAANAGNFVVAVAAPRGPGSGHVTVVLAEVPGQEAPRDEHGILTGIRESQAGSTNRRSFTERFADGANPWWTRDDMTGGSFWAHEVPDAWEAVERAEVCDDDAKLAQGTTP
jgi:hypothetical protein